MEALRYVYQAKDVVDCGPPEFALRTYLEHQDLRRVLREISEGGEIGSACEVGSGFGRMTVVLTEFCSVVHGYEREPHFVEIANRLIPAVDFRAVLALDRLPAPDGSYSLVLSFTVLQHISDAEVPRVIAEMKRITRKGGHVLICEETSEEGTAGFQDSRSHFCVGRPVQLYEEMMRPFRLVGRMPRRVEPTYPRRDTGAYMLFRAE